jgi:hypothetical protein
MERRSDLATSLRTVLEVSVNADAEVLDLLLFLLAATSGPGGAGEVNGYRVVGSERLLERSAVLHWLGEVEVPSLCTSSRDSSGIVLIDCKPLRDITDREDRNREVEGHRWAWGKGILAEVGSLTNRRIWFRSGSATMAAELDQLMKVIRDYGAMVNGHSLSESEAVAAAKNAGAVLAVELSPPSRGRKVF